MNHPAVSGPRPRASPLKMWKWRSDEPFAHVLAESRVQDDAGQKVCPARWSATRGIVLISA
jgi:hypothetical protein